MLKGVELVDEGNNTPSEKYLEGWNFSYQFLTSGVQRGIEMLTNLHHTAQQMCPEIKPAIKRTRKGSRAFSLLYNPKGVEECTLWWA